MGTDSPYRNLEQIQNPEELRKLPEDALPAIAKELREYLLNSVAQSGGHLAAGLGTVELTVALHYIFNTPHDRLVWDVGHQCYPHKILTERRERMHTIRKHGGLAGFPKRCESPYDTFGVGHSSTSISAALGMLKASEQTGVDRQVVAVIGDGAMTAGEAFEALNHAGDLNANMLVILNDNNMSISENVGAMRQHFARLIAGRLYTTVRESGKKVLQHMPSGVWELAKKAEEHAKGMVVPGTLFEEMGFNYYGPIDGHNIEDLVTTLRNLKEIRGPKLLHIVTCKGKGYAPAEENPITYHGVTPFDPKQGIVKKPSSGGPSYTQIFGDWLCDMAEQDPKLAAITPAMREGSGLVEFAKRFPDRYYDTAIAEQHAVTFAAGLACEGVNAVLAIYSTFLQRGYDQLIHDVAIQNLPVLFAIDRAGLVGADGETHNGAFDLSYLRCVPNMVVMAPADENECRQMLYTGHLLNQPAAVRYPRGTGPGVEIEKTMTALPIGKAQLRRKGSQIALLAFGTMVSVAEEIAAEFDATVVNMRFVKPLDEAMILELVKNHDLFVTLEENAVAGGAGSGVSELLNSHHIAVPTLNIGLPDEFINHGGQTEVLRDAGLDVETIKGRVASFLATQNCQNTPSRLIS